MAALNPEMSLMDWALWNAERGLRVFPVKGGAKFPPLVSAPYDAASTDPIQIIEWWSENPDANIGIDTSPLLIIDIDVKEHKNGYEAAEALGLRSLATFTVGTPSGGEHIYTRPPAPLPGGVDTLGPGIDTRGHHNYVLGVGSRIGGDVYSLKLGSQIIPTPEVALVRRAIVERSTVPLVDLDTDTAVRLALDFVRTAPVAVEGLSGDNHTFAVAAKVREYGISESVCFELLLEHWNAGCEPPWHPEDLRRKVENAYNYAQATPGVAHPDHIFGSVDVDPPPPPAPKPKQDWWSADDDFDEAEDEWLFYETLPRVGVCLLVAPSGGGKTFLETHLMDCVRTGEPFFNVKADELGSSLILASEASGSLKKRLRALKRPDLPHRIRVRHVGALASPGAWARLCEDVIREAEALRDTYGEPVRVISLDTLAASGMLADENDNSQAAVVMTLLSGLAERLRCLVLIVHHTTKAGKVERGAGALRAGADCVLEIQREGESPIRRLELTKSRDGETKAIGSFTLETVILGEDSRNRPIRTATLSTGVETLIADREPAHADKFWEAFDNVLAVPRDVDVAEGAIEFEGLRTEWRLAVGKWPDRAQRSNAHKTFAKIIEYYTRRLEIEEILIEGARFIRRREIRI